MLTCLLGGVRDELNVDLFGYPSNVFFFHSAPKGPTPQTVESVGSSYADAVIC